MKMRKVLALVATAVVALGLAACGGGDKLALSDSYSDATYGYSFKAPANAVNNDDAGEGKISLYWNDPSDLWVNTYVEEGLGDATVDDLAAFLVDQYDATVVSQDDTSVVTVCTDSDGDTNYTKMVIANDAVYTMDVYYHPADDETMQPVATAIMDSFGV